MSSATAIGTAVRHRQSTAGRRRRRGRRDARSTASATAEVAPSTASPSRSTPARFTAIMGPSGSGKSTLMHCLAGLDSLTSGRGLHRRDVPRQRSTTSSSPSCAATQVGFIFQAYNLIPTLTARENITLPLLARRREARPGVDRPRRSTPSASRDRLQHRPSELSGGQQQRVAVARALATQADDHLRRRADRQPRLAAPAPRSSSSCATRSTSSARRS